jgi:hypothetical protein
MPKQTTKGRRTRHRLTIEVPAEVYLRLRERALEVTAEAGRFVSLKGIAASAVTRRFGSASVAPRHESARAIDEARGRES